jgi:hypothetical protein
VPYPLELSVLIVLMKLGVDPGGCSFGLRRRSAAAELLGSGVRILLKARMLVSCLAPQQNLENQLLVSSCLSVVCLYVRNNSTPTKEIFMKFHI